MQCPACRKLMIAVEYQRIELDYCPNCKGVWFDSGELELLINCAGLGGCGLVNIIPKEIKIREVRRACPICGRVMFKGKIGREPQVVIDACRRGDGLWFDGGEVAALLNQLASGAPAGQESQQKVISFLSEVFKP